MISSPASTLLLQDLINAPSKAESILESLTAEQIVMIENTINRVKKRKLNKPSSTSHRIVVEEENSASTSASASASATAIANALAAAMVSAASMQLSPPLHTPTMAETNNAVTTTTVAPSKTITNVSTSNEPTSEMKDGIEWVSFVYSHNRTLKRYSIRTDINNVALDAVDDKFKTENCVYPRANLPKESYKGNRWAYETECNDLGWKLAWLNKTEIAGKRGLIQRAVDSYRNRYPSMRSRRVARQEKLLNGTLRKRKNKECDPIVMTLSSSENQQPSLEAAITKPVHQPKTIAIDDIVTKNRYRIKINIESISLDEISEEFRKQNCPFPKVFTMLPEEYIGGQARWNEDTLCNELCWKLAYLNPKILAGKRSLLQRALDVYRTKFTPSLKPRKYSSRIPSTQMISSDTIEQEQFFKISPPTPLTVSALNAQNALFEKKKTKKTSSSSSSSSTSRKSTTTTTMGHCFSLDDEASSSKNSGLTIKLKLNPSTTHTTTSSFMNHQTDQDPMISPSYDSIYSDARFSPFDESSCHTSSSSNSIACTPSPPVTADIFGFNTETDLYDSFMLPPVNDSFMLLDNEMKYDSLMSPSLSSNTANQDLVKLEEDFQDHFSSAAHLLDPLF
ncbi:uncharacterized protein BX663DRAFT_506747 [Cokeromyces recurvatus]|uniref:uncharacterized protein n=1 Tax=Cokeromyces recurvatus TaxID=90255 RepID=UPI0022200D1D|nr:uncharacterized protein BX663DRAFT_506747 [Cokeromyces recurvatus]KAI7903522.1 hypothetical protein BX663DRAFT_506747 [Cokeromyces recurvatus]